jgi:succinyl-CoA synthetase beta subunit
MGRQGADPRGRSRQGRGVKVAKSLDEVRQRSSRSSACSSSRIRPARWAESARLLVEEGADIKELYIGMVVDRGTQRVVLMASSEGGMDIEEVAAKSPEKIHKVFIDPATS